MTQTLTEQFYRSPRVEAWQGRNDAPPAGRLWQRVRCQDLRSPFTPSTPKELALLGFACDLGVSRNLGRPGASGGPMAFRAAAAGMPTHLPVERRVVDCGDVLCPTDALEEAQQVLGQQVARVIQEDRFPLLIGGGHEISWGTMQGLLEAYPGENIGILNLDAHFDMRPLTNDGLGHSGTGFLQMAVEMKSRGLDFDYLCLGVQRSGNTPVLFETAREWNATYVLAEDFFLHEGRESNAQLESFLSRHDRVYVTICLDAFSAAIAPGVSAPQPFGVMPWQVIPWLRKLAASGKVVALDFAEYNPQKDVDGHTARLLTGLVFEWMHAL